MNNTGILCIARPPQEPRIKLIHQIARAAWKLYNVNKFPAGPELLCSLKNHPNFQIKDCQHNEICNDGTTIAAYIPRRGYCYLILLNAHTLARWPERYWWTLIHELGHTLLGHMRFPKDSLTQHEKDVIEWESHFFAAEFSAPFAIMRYTGAREAKQIKDLFGLSWQAAQKRESDYQRFKNTPIAQEEKYQVLNWFSDWLVNKGFGYKTTNQEAKILSFPPTATVPPDKAISAWTQIMKRVGRRSPSLMACLATVEFCGVAGERLLLRPNSPLEEAWLKQPEKRRLVNETAASIFGHPISLKLLPRTAETLFPSAKELARMFPKVIVEKSDTNDLPF